ncbi:hypothetical protein CRUP_014736, partial [Coryphaenoides rupestris]
MSTSPTSRRTRSAVVYTLSRLPTSHSPPTVLTVCRRGARLRLQLPVDLTHHVRRLLVAAAVDVPQHQGGASAGELLREEPPEAAARARDHAHLARHALLLGPHHPAGAGARKRPQHLEQHHQELRHDHHHPAA